MSNLDGQTEDDMFSSCALRHAGAHAGPLTRAQARPRSRRSPGRELPKPCGHAQARGQEDKGSGARQGKLEVEAGRQEKRMERLLFREVQSRIKKP